MEKNTKKYLSSLPLFCFYRKYIISRKQSEVPLSVPWDPRNQVRSPLVVRDTPFQGLTVAVFRGFTWYHLFRVHTYILIFIRCILYILCVCFQVYLSYNNVSALKTLAARKNWRLTTEKDKVSAVLFLKQSYFPDFTGECFSSLFVLSAECFVCFFVPPGTTLHP